MQKKYDVVDASLLCVYMVFGMFLVHVEGCKMAGTCVPSGKGFFQFMVDNTCPFRAAFTWGKFWLVFGSWHLRSLGGRLPEAKGMGLRPGALA